MSGSFKSVITSWDSLCYVELPNGFSQREFIASSNLGVKLDSFSMVSYENVVVSAFSSSISSSSMGWLLELLFCNGD